MDIDYGTPIPPLEEEPEKKSNVTLIIIIVAVVLLCCCCITIAGLVGWLWFYGDELVNSIPGFLYQWALI